LAPSDSGREHPSEPSVRVTVGDAAFGNQIQVGTTGSRQEQTVSLSENPGVSAYLLAYRQLVDGLHADEREVALSSLATAEAELKSKHPDQARLREALVTLRSIAEGVAGNAAFNVLLELGRQLF
jgi:hypothetical protein